MHAVFVYGSLKKGFYNHAFLRGARFAGSVVTAQSFSLFSFGPYPGLYHTPEYPIAGELYFVNDAGLQRLDELEENGREYLREKIELRNAAGESFSAWCYFCLLPHGRGLRGSGVQVDDQGIASWQRRR